MTRRPSPAPIGSAGDPNATSEIVIRACIDDLDQVALAMERKWGVGRLRLLVGVDLCARFDAQQEKLDAAIATSNAGFVHTQAEGMKRAWAALDQAATSTGQKPIAPEIWECVLPSSGEVVALVRTEPEAHAVAQHQRVFTTAEIGRLIDGLPGAVHAVKRAFPGAEITSVRPPIDWKVGDALPF